jgi:hypothetical protein
VQRSKMLGQALRLGDTGRIVVCTFEGHADTFSPGWFHHFPPTRRCRHTPRLGSAVESSSCLQRLLTNHEIR